MDIQYRSIDDLKAYENNPRNNDPAVDAVAASIKNFGFKVPIVIDKNDVIVCGHTRVKAAEKIGMKVLPCVVADDLDEEKINAFRLADNKTAELAEWDIEKLVEELQDISEIDMSEFGFDVSVFEEEEDQEIQEDNFDEEVADNTVLGDVYELGDHRLICGDSTDPDVWAKLMGDELADFVFTDPPYGVAIGDKNEALNTVLPSGRCTKNIANDTLGPEELYDVLLHAFINVREHCAEDACYYVTSPQGGSLCLMMMMMKDAGLEVRHVLMWRKNTATFSLGRLDYDYQHEPIFYTWTKSHHNFRGGQCRTTIWDFDKPRKCDLHPTMKPIELIANAILDGTKKGMIVLDAFGGSGSTLIAAEQLGRRCRMIELDPHYCDVIVSRWEKFTGKKAIRNGETTVEK